MTRSICSTIPNNCTVQLEHSRFHSIKLRCLRLRWEPRNIGAIYERLLIPGVTDEKTAFTYVIEAPFSGVRTRPEMMHHYMVRIDAQKKRAEWIVDGKMFFKTESLPVAPKGIMVGWGLFTLKPVDSEKGSTSLHGQGATGIWKNFRYSTP